MLQREEEEEEVLVESASWPRSLDRVLSVPQSITSWPCAPSILFALVALVGSLVIIKLCRLIALRRKLKADFERGNIKLAGSPGLFAGHLNSTLVRHDNLKQIHLLHQQLGNNYALFFGPDPWLMSVDLDLIQRIFVTEGSTHVDITLFRLPFVSEINESLAQVAGDKWRVTRRVMSPSFTPKQMKSDRVFEQIGAVCDLFMEFIEENAQRHLAANNSRTEIDVNHGFKQFSLEVIFRIAFDRVHNARLLVDQRDQLIEWIDEGSELIASHLVKWGIMFGPTLRRLLGFCCQFTALGSCISHIHSIISDNLLARRKLRAKQAAFAGPDGSQSSGGGNHDHRMIDSLMESFEAGKLDDCMLQANLFFILLSGFETTANTLTFLFWLLASHQDEQEKLRAELARAGEQAQYLDWTIKETLRLYPAVPAAIGRRLEHDIEHEGMRIKKGVTVIASIWSIHRWPAYWGADVERFRPARMAQEEREKEWPLRFFAFAAGPRYCIGKHLALAEIKTLATRILMKYRVELPPGDSGSPIESISPNMIHFIIPKPVKLTFTPLSCL